MVQEGPITVGNVTFDPKGGVTVRDPITGQSSRPGAQFSGGGGGGGGTSERRVSRAVRRISGLTEEQRQNELARLAGEERARVEAQLQQERQEKLQKQEAFVQRERQKFPTEEEFPEAKEKQRLIEEAGQEQFEVGEKQRMSQEQLRKLTKEFREGKPTKFQRLKERVREVEAREQKRRRQSREEPFFSVLTEQGIPATVIKTADIVGEALFKVGDIVTTKVSGKERAGKGDVIKGGQFISDIGLLMGFGVATPTTAQLEKEIAKTSKVIFKGAQQKVTDPGLVRTDIKFLTKTGKQIRRGKAVGFTKFDQVDDVIMGQTIVRGKEARAVIDLTKGAPKTKFVNVKQFVGTETSLSRNVDDIFIEAGKGLKGAGVDKVSVGRGFEQISIGRVGVLGKKGIEPGVERFIAGSVGKTGDKFTTILTKSVSKKGDVVSMGIVKDVKAVDRIINIKDLKLFGPAKASVQNVVTAQVKKVTPQSLAQITPKFPTIQTVTKTTTATQVPSIISPVTTGKGAPSITTPTITKQVTTPKVIPSIKTKQTGAQAQVVTSGAKLSQIQFQTLGIKTRQAQVVTPTQTTPQLVKQRSIQLTMQRQRLAQKTALRQIQIQKQRFQGIPTFRIPRTPTPTPPPPIFFKGGKGKKKIGISPKFTVAERRYGKFKTIGTGLSLQKAVSVGRGRVARGLGATFKITGGKGIQNIRIPTGFYQKAPGIFIEKRKHRISRRGEKIGLQRARRKKK